MSQHCVLETILPQLIQWLNIPNIRPYLRQNHVLTDDEFEQLEMCTTQQAVEKLVKFLKRKGPGHEQMFLSILKNSLNADHHEGHITVIQLLEEKLKNPANVCGVQFQHHQHQLTDQPQAVVNGNAAVRDGPYHVRGEGTGPGALPEQNGSLEQTLEKFALEDSRSKLVSRAPLQLAQFEYIEGSCKKKKEIVDLKCKIARDSENITARFAALVLGVYRLLACKQTPPEEIRIALLFLGCYKTQEKNTHMFSSSSDIAQAQTLAALIECLHKYSSWFNYRLLKFVALEFGGEAGKGLIDKYEDDLKKYFQNLIAYQCPEFSLSKGIPPGFEQLEVKVDWDFKSCLAQDVVLFQAKLADLLGLEPHIFQLKSIEEGCVLFLWALPSAVIPHILEEVVGQMSTLQQWEVLQVQALGKSIHISEPMVGSNREITTKPPCEDRCQKQEHPRPLKVTASNSTTCSSLSEFTPTPKCSSSGHFQIGDNIPSFSEDSMAHELLNSTPITPEEAEIFSIYSGVLGDISHTNSPIGTEEGSIDTSTSQLLQERSPGNETSVSVQPGSLMYALPELELHPAAPIGEHPPQYYCSEINLLATTPTPREARAMSYCEGIQVCDTELKHQFSQRNSTSRRANLRCRRLGILRSPSRLLPKFLRNRRSRRPYKEGSSSNLFPILELSDEPRPGGLHYYHHDSNKLPLSKAPLDQKSSSGSGTASPAKVPQIFVQFAAKPHAQIPEPPQNSLSSVITVHASELTSAPSPPPSSQTNTQPVEQHLFSSVSTPFSIAPSPFTVTTPKSFQYQFSGEVEEDTFTYERPLRQGSFRARSSSEPQRTHLQTHSRNTNTSQKDTPQRYRLPSVMQVTEYSSIRVASPENSIGCASSRTSGFFSQSDIQSLVPDSPTSRLSSQFPSQESFSAVESTLVRTHSLNTRSRYSVHTSKPMKSQVQHSKSRSLSLH